MAKHLFLKTTIKFAILTLWFLVALAWNEVAKSVIDNFATANTISFFKFMYFLVAMIFVTIAVYYLVRLMQDTRA